MQRHRMLVKSCQMHQADLGFALDGDGDRIMLVDANGEVVDGDQIVFIIARDALKNGQLKWRCRWNSNE